MSINNTPIMFFQNNTLFRDETFIPISNDKIKNIINGRYTISNYGRIYDNYTGLFCVGYLSDGIMYVDLVGSDNIISLNIIDLIAIIFHDESNKYPRLKDRKSRVLFHKDNIEWTDVDKNVNELDKNIKYVNNQRIYCGEGSTFPTKLTDKKVHEICKLLEENKLTQYEIADMYHVSHDSIYSIKAGKNWKHISKDYNIPKVIPRGQATGENNPKAKYKESDIRKICELLEQHKYKNVEIANMVGVHKQLVANVKNKKNWNHISDQYNI